MRGLYAIVDPALCGDVVATAQEILLGGCAAVQLRCKGLHDRDHLALARRLVQVCKPRAVPLFVNDRVDIARAAGAAGVHLGQTDLPLPDARSLFPGGLIGVSTHDRAQAQAAVAAGADLIGFGPIYATQTKLDAAPVVGVRALAEVVRASGVPVVAIGGIGLDNVAEVAATGVAMVAALSAVLGASRPRVAARELHHALGGS